MIHYFYNTIVYTQAVDHRGGTNPWMRFMRQAFRLSFRFVTIHLIRKKGKIMSMSRREALSSCLATGIAAVSSNMACAAESKDPGLEFVFEVIATLEKPLIFGQTGIGERRIIGITGGTVKGPALNGIVLPGGADWQIVRDDGVSEINARYSIKADDGALIYIEAPGIREASPAVIQRINSGEIVDPSEYYFRTTPRLETASEKYAWMGRRLFVCKGIRHPDGVEIRYYKVT
jgi:hypothetical protein